MIKFKKAVALVMIGGFLLGASTIALAYVIPGVDEPFNPPAYYSPTTPDPEDSPSPFFYKDLGWNGNQVYDPIREKHKKDKVKNWQDILDIMLKKLDLNIINSRMLSSDNLKSILLGAFGVNDDIDSKNKVVPMMNAAEGTTMRAFDRYDDYDREYSISDKLKLNQTAVQNTTSFTKIVLDDSKKGQLHNEQLQQEMYRAEGTNEHLQVGNYLRYENANNRYRLLELSSNKLALMVQEIFSDVDDDIAEARNNNMTFQSVDPTNMDDYQKEHYKPRKPLGFPDFE